MLSFIGNVRVIWITFIPPGQWVSQIDTTNHQSWKSGNKTDSLSIKESVMVQQSFVL